jgi:uncharacterized protein YkwD
VAESRYKSSLTLLLACFLWAARGSRVSAEPPSSAHINSKQTNATQGSPPRLAAILGPRCPADPQCPKVPPLAQEMVELINWARLAPAYYMETKGRARRLRWDPRLAEIAAAHSEAMLQQHYFGHVDPNGDSPVERFYKARIQWRSMGENIAINYTVPLAEASFMSEPPSLPNHRGNILNPAFNCIGVAVVRAPDAKVYITQDFADEE